MAGNPVSEEKMFADILSSMGIDKYDPIVPAALNEYARSKSPFLFRDETANFSV